jgi:4a-hydroxytetrahydrobiopterin dehydratase
MDKLAPAEITEALAALPEWSEAGEAIQRTYQFADFVTSMQFVNAVAAAAEKTQHHPDIMVRYSKVTLTYSTHDAGGLTMKDFDAAQSAEDLAASLPRPEAPTATRAVAVKKKK